MHIYDEVPTYMALPAHGAPYCDPRSEPRARPRSAHAAPARGLHGPWESFRWPIWTCHQESASHSTHMTRSRNLRKFLPLRQISRDLAQLLTSPFSEAPERLHTQPSECLDYERAHPIIMVYRNSYCVPACPYPFYTFGLSCHFNAKSDLELYVQPEVTHFKSPKANHHA